MRCKPGLFLAGFGQQVAAFHDPARRNVGCRHADLGERDAAVPGDGLAHLLNDLGLLVVGAAGSDIAVQLDGGSADRRSRCVFEEKGVDKGRRRAGLVAMDIGNVLGDLGLGILREHIVFRVAEI